LPPQTNRIYVAADDDDIKFSNVTDSSDKRVIPLPTQNRMSESEEIEEVCESSAVRSLSSAVKAFLTDSICAICG
jgi:hypothetical protein